MDHMKFRSALFNFRSALVIIAYGIFFVYLPVAEAGSITVRAVDGSVAGRIEVREINGVETLSMTQWSQLIDADLDWDYVTGVAEMRFHDHRLRVVDRGRGVWINGRMHSLPGPVIQQDGDLWIPLKVLDDLVDALWEGEIIWNSVENELRLYAAGFQGNQDDDRHDGQWVIVLDAGHGGSDFGCLAGEGVAEKEAVLNLALRVGDILTNRMGAYCVFTRKSDQNPGCDERVAEANRSVADLFISFHVAPLEDLQGNSFNLYLPSAESEESEIGAKLELWESRPTALLERMKTYAKSFGDGMAATANEKKFGIFNRDLSILKGLSMPAFVLELSWESAFYGDVPITEESGRNRAAEAIFDGIRSCLNVE
ncbi:MAG: N-acetylmuramoyl-L-alanine amidase [bacterium]